MVSGVEGIKGHPCPPAEVQREEEGGIGLLSNPFS